jgi:hypothetical protein
MYLSTISPSETLERPPLILKPRSTNKVIDIPGAVAK